MPTSSHFRSSNPFSDLRRKLTLALLVLLAPVLIGGAAGTENAFAVSRATDTTTHTV